MKSTHFRLNVDLSEFFDDARRTSRIFVDISKFKQIIHMMQHISNLFNIMEPFHLLLNDTEYLPPTEDVKVLEKNDTILLVLYFVILFYIINFKISYKEILFFVAFNNTCFVLIS